MINRKDTPAPFAQRNNPPHFPSSRVYDQQAAPHTPQNKSRSKRTSKVHRGTPRQTYMDGNARGTADDNARDERISHDLNLTDATRYSVVDNMLQSLNPDQTKLYTPPKDHPPFSSGSDQTSSSRSATQTQHFHSSSTGSDYTFSLGDSPERRSSQFGRGRRSHSSSNYQSVLGRIDSVQDKGEVAEGIKTRAAQVQRRGGVEGLGKVHARKRSKGSASSSADFGRSGNQIWMPNAMARRSASFDHGYRSRALQSDLSAGTHSAMPNVMSQSNIYNDIDAAPTPTVPAGPRRDISPVFPPHPGHAPPVTPGSQRRDSSKSTKSSYAKRSKNETLHWEHPVPRMTSRRGSKQASALPSHLTSRQPSPVRQYSEPVMTTRQEPPAASKDSVKERPGFFRRVFGSSRGMTPAADLHTPPRLLASSRGGTRSNSRNGFSAPDTSQRPTPSEDLPGPPPDVVPPQLVKKPSSFFRRRKKSISESNPTPALPPHLQPAAPTSKNGAAERDSVSSLRKVMTPYLDQQPAKQGPEAPKASSAAAYHSLPSRPNVLRPTRSFEPPPRSKDSTVGADSPRQAQNLTSEIPPKTHLNPEDISSIQTRKVTRPIDTSFLNDDSSDSRTPEIGEQGLFSNHDSAPSQPAPTSVPSDLTPERTASKGVLGLDRYNHTDSPGGSSVLTLRDLNLPAASRSTVITPRKAETRDTPSTSQATPSANPPSPPDLSHNIDRVWLEPAHSEEKMPPSISDPAKFKDSPMSAESEYFSAASTAHSLKGIESVGFSKVEPVEIEPKESLDIDHHSPTDADRALAKQVFDGDEAIATKATAASWLGEPGLDRTRIRKAYMQLFEWQNLNILVALRDLCGRLYLKGEAQQVDRILDAFSTRWCACNPQHGFKATDVVHTICYSVLLLNTDLHQAEIETKMTRQQFLKNILPTVRRVVRDAAPNAFTSARASTMPPPRVWTEGSSGNIKPSDLPESNEGRRSFEGQRPVYKLSQRPSDQTVYSSQPPTPLEFSTGSDCGPLVKTPFHGKQSTWENQIEIVLKDFFNSIRQQPLPLHGTESKKQSFEHSQPSNSLSVMTSNMLRRTPSMLSKAGSENQSYSRGRPSDNRSTTGRWQSKTRSRPRLYPASTGASSSRRSSFDEHSSVTTPSITSAWSKFSSLGRTQTTLSIDSLATSFPQADYQQSIGFANALSQAIIREEGAAIDDETLRAAPLLEDESLELAGAPWAKEGILKHKHHLEAVDKRAKDRNWAESFAVIEKGYMRLFSFSMNAKSLRQKAKARTPGGVVGGGNWADNAETLGTFTLRQTIASALPPPGYSKARPHVWALSLPTGAVHIFQVGTPEIVKEFVTTANYWSARLSKEPMVGGISNIEYGWGDSIINPALLPPPDMNAPAAAVSSSHGSGSHGSRPSLHGSIRSTRSSMDQGSFKPKLPGDKVTISDWTPPQQRMVPSALMEVDQLKALANYVKCIEEELQRHNELRGAVLLAFSPRHPNSAKAMTNWERKSSYLLREIVKFRTYIDCLMAAQTLKEKIYRDRASVDADKENEKKREGASMDGTVMKNTEAKEVGGEGEREVNGNGVA